MDKTNPTSPPAKRVTFWLDPETDLELSALSRRVGISKSELFRKAVRGVIKVNLKHD